MALLDLFRPTWRHSDPMVRLEAVRTLDGRAVLRRVAAADDWRDLRLAALGRLAALAATLNELTPIMRAIDEVPEIRSSIDRVDKDRDASFGESWTRSADWPPPRAGWMISCRSSAR